MEEDNSRLPIALRRTPRRSATKSQRADAFLSLDRRRHCTAPRTPSEPRSRKRVRQSEADLTIVVGTESVCTPPLKTDRRQATPSNKRRRHSKIAGPSSKYSQAVGADLQGDHVVGSGSNEIRIFPLRAILDDRVKRRIRRNGLSEEMNMIYSERRRRARGNMEEMSLLRDRLAAKEAENETLREQSSLLQDTSRIQELENEITDLRNGLGSGKPRPTEQHDHHYEDWNMEAADGFTDHDSFMDVNDHFEDDTTIDVESSSPPVHPRLYVHVGPTLTALTPPNTSPTKPASPGLPCYISTPSCDASVQACVEDVEKTALEIELASLRRELASLNRALEDQQQLEDQLAAKLSSAQTVSAVVEGDPDLQLQMDILLQTLAEKTTALADINASLSAIGHPDADAKQIVSTMTIAFRSARQDLEQLFPGQVALPLSYQGAEVLDVMLQRLREAAGQVRDHKASLDGYRALESSLRQQLHDRVDAMNGLARELRSKDDRIFKLEDDVERLEDAVEGYRTCVSELEANARRMETERQDIQARSTDEMQRGRQMVAERDAQLAEMEANLGSMISVTANLRAQLVQAHVDREMGMAVIEASHAHEITLRDTKMLELQEDITRLKEALSQAHETVAELRTENGRLQGDADRDKRAARDTVTALRTQLLQTLQVSEAFLGPSSHGRDS